MPLVTGDRRIRNAAFLKEMLVFGVVKVGLCFGTSTFLCVQAVSFLMSWTDGSSSSEPVREWLLAVVVFSAAGCVYYWLQDNESSQ